MECVVSGVRVGIALAPESFPDVLLKWCFEAGGNGQEYSMIYVRGPLRSIPTPVGRVPISQVSKSKVDEFTRAQEMETKEFEQKMQRVCDSYKVKATFLVVESDQVGKALVQQIEKYQLSSFIVGSPRSLMRMRAGVADYVMNHAPSFCAVHCVSKASRLVSFRERNASSPKKAGKKMRRWFGSVESLPRSSSTCSEWSSGYTTHEEPASRPSEACNNVEEAEELPEARDNVEEAHEIAPQEPRTPELNEMRDEHELFEEQETSSLEGCNDTVQEDNIAEAGGTNSELVEMLKLQLQGARLEAAKANDVARRECLRSREAEAQARRALAQVEEMSVRVSEEAKRREAAVMAAEMVKRRLQEECERHAEALRLAESMQRALEEEMKKKETETKMLMEGLESQAWKGKYTEFSYEELQFMTNNFAASNKLGEGGYGSVYRGRYYHTDVAVKVLNKNGLQGPEEFKLEVEVLSRLHHPHVVLLLGGCSEHGCLVYEYLANGSLEDRLCCTNNSAPIPCYTRYRIAVETAKALMFLHKARPQPVVHRDLKPANILLDSNFRTKIGDVGCARFMPRNKTGCSSSSVSTTPVGTFAYIDPEYQREGSVSPKSDVYSFGIVLLRLLTALTPIGIATTVSAALEQGSLLHILDERAGTWPVAVAMQLAYIGLGCAEPQRQNRLELEQVLDMLVHMESMFENELQTMRRLGVPALFVCPILQEVMERPVIAADGYTYEHEAIRLWLARNNTSPMTNLPLENKSLIANRLIRSAICEWRASNG